MNLCRETLKSILTFGYGNRKDYSVFSHYLKTHEIQYVIDVRLNPRAWTRKWYGCAIENFCSEMDVQYISETSLGNTSGGRKWIAPDIALAEQRLLEIARILNNKETGNILLLCAELDYSRCHRTQVAERLQSMTDFPIKHLQ
jgi:uncharacterized protein (DUF488 family)